MTNEEIPYAGAPAPVSPMPSPPPMPAGEPPLPGELDLKGLFENLLRRPRALVVHLAGSRRGALLGFAVMALLAMGLFGVVLGCFAKHEQLWAVPAKLTGGLCVAALICFPSLYIFATLAGARMAVGHLATCMAGALALAGLLLLGFAPAVWIFAESTDAVGFMGTLAVGVWLVAFYFALRFLKTAVSVAGASQRGPMFVWSLVFLLVTLQMTTTLRPLLGRADVVLTQEKKFFLDYWRETLWGAAPGEAAGSGPESVQEWDFER